MDLKEAIKIIGLTLALLIIIFSYHQLLKKFVDNANRKLWFACGLFLFFSTMVLYSPLSTSLTLNELNQSIVNIVIGCFWWLSLNLLLNQLLEHWLWNSFFLHKGIIVTKILRDSVSFVLLIIILAAIVHFVFLKSVFGIFTASGVVAIILGYSAQTTLSDIFAGLGLNTAKQFSEGDWIKVNDGMSIRLAGRVIDINWRFVNLITEDNNHLSIPNSVISKYQIINLSQPDLVHGAVLTIPLQDKITPAQFKKILVSAAHQCAKVERIPEPHATLSEVRSTEYIYQLVYYTKEINEALVNDQLLSIIWYQCRRKQIKITSNEMADLIEPLSPNILKSFLLKTDLFSLLNEDEINLVTTNAICHHYGPPEMILEYEQENSSLFVIYTGSIDVYISKEIQPQYLVATLGSGQYFGEMSLLTGDLCSASMVVRAESIVIEITHDSIKTLFSQEPALIEKMTEIIISRKHLNQDIKNSNREIKVENHQTLIDRMVSNVRHFFKHDQHHK